MHRLINLCITVCLISNLTGCSSPPVIVHLPDNRGLSSETAGQGKWGMSFQVTSPKNLELSSNYRSVPVDVLSPAINGDVELKMQIKLGLTDYWDVGIGPVFSSRQRNASGVSDTATIALESIHTQLLLFGENHTKSKAGNFSVSLALATGLSRTSFTSSSGVGKFFTDTGFFDRAILAGYRISDDILIYTSLFGVDYNYSGERDGYSYETFNGTAQASGNSIGIELKDSL